jgi:hypothetical protein
MIAESVRPTKSQYGLVRKKLLTAAQQDDDCLRVASAIDHLFRVIMLRNERQAFFSVDVCKGSNVIYYRVVLSETERSTTTRDKSSIQGQPSSPQSAFTTWLRGQAQP